MKNRPLRTIESQIRSAAKELRSYEPTIMGWEKPARSIAGLLVPTLCSDADAIAQYVEGVLNAPIKLRALWNDMRKSSNASPETLQEFDTQLELDDVLRETVTGETISKVFTRSLLQRHPQLRCNGSSDYPDIYDSSHDYSRLPLFTRSNATKYGAARKGKLHHPVRVPDGIEIKTCRKNLRVDCHHPHAGLHVILLYTESIRLFCVTDIQVGFLTTHDYRESNRNTTSTTVKYSFGGERFVSVMHPFQ